MPSATINFASNVHSILNVHYFHDLQWLRRSKAAYAESGIQTILLLAPPPSHLPRFYLGSANINIVDDVIPVTNN